MTSTPRQSNFGYDPDDEDSVNSYYAKQMEYFRRWVNGDETAANVPFSKILEKIAANKAITGPVQIKSNPRK